MNRFKTAFLSEFVKHSKSIKMVSANAFKRVCKTFFKDLYRYDLVQTPKMNIDFRLLFSLK